MIKAKINGETKEFNDGVSILEACQSLGIDIPTLCHDDRLKPSGHCRMCIVEVAGATRQAASCQTKLTEGMDVKTHSPKIEKNRQANLKMLALNYPLEDFLLYPDKKFHALCQQYGLIDTDFAQPAKSIDDSHTFIQVDMTRCIDCFACVRICEELQGQFVWQVIDRGHETKILPDNFGKFGESSCVSCGACSDVCPTGALEDKSILKKGVPTDWTKTVCPYCGTGCEMEVGTRNGEIVQIKPAKHTPVNNGHLCVKGRYGYEFAQSKDRITEPMIRQKDGTWKEVSWEDAFDYTVKELRRINETYGKEVIGVLGSARATNEENYLAQKFARVCFETNNVDCCARVCHTPSAAALKMMLGTGAATNSFHDVELAKTLMICGSNPTENHPIVGAKIKQAIIKNGLNLILVDPRKTELAKYAKIHLQHKAGTNIPLFNSIAYTIIEEGLTDDEFIKNRVEEFDEFWEFLGDYAPEKVAEICDVPADLIREAARMYATQKPSMSVHGLGMTEHIQGTESVMSLVNMALITGNMGKRGTGVNPLRGQNNVQGSAQMGCDPGILTGSIAIEEGREHFEKVWQTAVPTAKGKSLLAMLDTAAKGTHKALWVIGYDVYLSQANTEATGKSFEGMELVIVQDMFMNETAKHFAHVFFPAVSSFEKDGTFMNGERRVSLLRQVIEPKGNAKNDWEIICGLAKAYGKGEYFNFNSAEEIWNEIREVWRDSYGITYERIAESGLQWGCPTTDHPGTEFLHQDSFTKSKTAALKRIKYRPTQEIMNEEFPFRLTTGRHLYHFNAGTMTMRTDIVKIHPTDVLEISPQDAGKLSLINGEKVRVRSRYGQAVLPVHIVSKVKSGELFTTFHDAETKLNRITSNYRDKYVQAPEYKVTAVQIEKILD
ncbi:MAG TPA: formate dehydrogenase subunit alpha [Pyrinomonadaceae bacterium]|nr:formate dehydrogenase subunit alpha [Pyrinomonadaceae bacterium]